MVWYGPEGFEFAAIGDSVRAAPQTKFISYFVVLKDRWNILVVLLKGETIFFISLWKSEMQYYFWKQRDKIFLSHWKKWDSISLLKKWDKNISSHILKKSEMKYFYLSEIKYFYLGYYAEWKVACGRRGQILGPLALSPVHIL